LQPADFPALHSEREVSHLEMNVNNFYERLNYWLQEKKLTKYQLAKKCHVKETTIYNMIDGKNNIQLETQGKIIRALGVSIGKFWGEPDAIELSGLHMELQEVSKDFTTEQMERLIAYATGLGASPLGNNTKNK
jgi:plasmid maintenance system antidote protein VapI